MLEPGTRIERYEVERQLGQGGIAIVYLMRHTTLKTRHALKVVTQAGVGLRNRLLQEGMLQASLRHPNIVAVTDVLDVDGSPGLLMEFIEGPSLEQLLRQGPLDAAMAEAIFRGVVAGVGCAHAQGVVHRDLKPANVMMATHQGHWLPKVADFGLAKAIEGSTSGLTQTRTGSTMGTPSYMAPEQIRDAKRADHRADVFALGALLYEMVCGRMAFGQGDVLDIFNAVATASYVPPETLVPDIPAHLLGAIRGCLVVSPEFRIPDCEALERVLDGEPWVPHGSGGETFYGAPDPEPVPATPQPVGLSQAAWPVAAAQPVVAAQHVAGPDAVPRPPPPPPFEAHQLVTPLDSMGSIAPMSLPPPSEPGSEEPAVRRWLSGFSVGCVTVAMGLGAVAVLGLVLAVPLLWEEPSGPTGLEPDEVVPVPVAVEPEQDRKTTDPPAEETATKPAKVASDPVKKAPPVPVPVVTEPAPVIAEAVEVVEAPAPRLARVKAVGADKVVLKGKEGQFPPGMVPPGHYSVDATFNGEVVVGAASIDVKAGQRLTLRCDPDFLMCKPD